MRAEHFTLIDAALAGECRTEQYQGRDYLVVPIVALTEGVIHAMNSDCDELVPGDELSAVGWELKPLFVGHPLHGGVPVSGAHPSVSADAVGFVRHATVGDKTLRMQAWVDKEKADDEMLDMLKANLGMDVSVGVFTRNEDTEGEHDGKTYASIWRNIRPDHLALLPKDKGACSWEMGCGVRSASLKNAWQTTTGHHNGGEKAAAQAHETARTAHQFAAKAHEAAINATTKEGIIPDKAARDAEKASTRAEALSARARAASDKTGDSPNDSDTAHEDAKLAKSYAKVGAHGGAYHSHHDAISAHERAGNVHASKAGHPKGIIRSANQLDTEQLDEQFDALDEELLKTLRSIPQSVRDRMPKEDFAGPNESYPIEQPVDIHNAAQAIGRAKSGDTAGIKAKILEIAKRKGPTFEARLPEEWKTASGRRNSAVDQKRVQAMHDQSVELGADCSGTTKTAGAGCSCQQHKEAAMEKKDRVKALIGAKDSGYTAADQAWLEAVPDDRLEALEILAKGGIKAAASKADAEKVIVDAAKAHDALKNHAAGIQAKAEKDEEPKAAAIKALKATGKCVLGDEALKACSLDEINAMIKAANPAKFEDLLATAEPAIRDAINEGKRVGENKKDETIKVLIESKRCDYTAEQLKAMSQVDLDKLVKLANVKVAQTDFSGQGVVREGDGTAKVVPAPPSLNDAVKAAAAKKVGK